MEDFLEKTVRELAKILIEIYEPGHTLGGQGDVRKSFDAEVKLRMDTPIGSKKAWLLPKSRKESFDYSPHFVVFKERCFFMKINAIGMDDRITDAGELDGELDCLPIAQVLGKGSMDLILKTAYRNAHSPVDGGPRHITFIGIFDSTEDVEGWQFKGILPLDKRLDSVAFFELGQETVI